MSTPWGAFVGSARYTARVAEYSGDVLVPTARGRAGNGNCHLDARERLSTAATYKITGASNPWEIGCDSPSSLRLSFTTICGYSESHAGDVEQLGELFYYLRDSGLTMG